MMRFVETQRFVENKVVWFATGFSGACALVPGLIIYERTGSLLYAFGVALLAMIGPVLAMGMGMRTEVNGEMVRVKALPIPFTSKMRFPEIVAAEKVTYRPLREFGGWGLRFGRHRKALTVSGNEGVEVTLRSGKRVVIGSKDAAGLLSAIEHYLNG